MFYRVDDHQPTRSRCRRRWMAESGVVSVSGEVAEFSEGLDDQDVYIAERVGYPRVDRVPQCGGADLGQERGAPFGKSALL